jgi:hypothetical protein
VIADQDKYDRGVSIEGVRSRTLAQARKGPVRGRQVPRAQARAVTIGVVGSVAVDVEMRSNASPNESRVHTVEVVERVPTHADVVGGRCAATLPWA